MLTRRRRRKWAARAALYRRWDDNYRWMRGWNYIWVIYDIWYLRHIVVAAWVRQLLDAKMPDDGIFLSPNRMMAIIDDFLMPSVDNSHNLLLFLFIGFLFHDATDMFLLCRFITTCAYGRHRFMLSHYIREEMITTTLFSPRFSPFYFIDILANAISRWEYYFRYFHFIIFVSILAAKDILFIDDYLFPHSSFPPL